MRHLPVLVLTALVLTHGTAAADWLSLRSDHFQLIGNTTAGQLRDVAVRVVTRINADPARISDAEADAWFADLLNVMGRPDEAATRAKAALAGKPDSDLALAVLGTLHMRQGRTAEGLDHLYRAVKSGPRNERVQFAYANALIGSGNRDDETMTQVAQALERAIELRPGYREARIQLATYGCVTSVGFRT